MPEHNDEVIAGRARDACGIHGHGDYDRWTVEVVESVREQIDEGDDRDELAHEVADDAVPIYTAELMALGAASIDLACYEPESYDATNGSAERVLSAAAYEVARAIAEHARTEITEVIE